MFRSISPDSFSKIAAGVSSIATTAAIVAAGLWAVTRFSVLLEARIAEAEADKAEAEAAIAQRSAEAKEIVNVDLAALVLTTKSRGERWVSVALTLKNTGSKDHIISLEKDVRFYVAKVLQTKDNGEVQYDKMLNLTFDYADKSMTWFNLKAGAESDVYRAIKRVDSAGVYIARFSVVAPEIDNFPAREYRAQTYVFVD